MAQSNFPFYVSVCDDQVSVFKDVCLPAGHFLLSPKREELWMDFYTKEMCFVSSHYIRSCLLQDLPDARAE